MAGLAVSGAAVLLGDGQDSAQVPDAIVEVDSLPTVVSRARGMALVSDSIDAHRGFIGYRYQELKNVRVDISLSFAAGSSVATSYRRFFALSERLKDRLAVTSRAFIREGNFSGLHLVEDLLSQLLNVPGDGG